MSRFYISDGVRPGRRSPSVEYAVKQNGVGSEVMNEAQAIARGRKLEATQSAVASFRYWKVMFRSGGAMLLNEIELFEASMVNRALGVVPSYIGSPLFTTWVSSLTDGNTTIGVGAATYFGFNPANNCGYLLDLGVARPIKTLRLHGPSGYGSQSVQVHAGSTSDCTDFATAVFPAAGVDVSSYILQ